MSYWTAEAKGTTASDYEKGKQYKEPEYGYCHLLKEKVSINEEKLKQ